MNKEELILKIFTAIGNAYRFFIVKPIKGFFGLKFKYQVLIVIFILTIFDGIRFFIFDTIMWLIK